MLFDQDVARNAHFEFGANWQSFLSVLDDKRIAEAERSLKTMLSLETLAGKTFLDIGSGSGLFSLAAMKLNAKCVHSFDYDLESVACTQELKRSYFSSAQHWAIEQGSVLDADYLHTLGQWDIVYSWGVLHHTGKMWQALENVSPLVSDSGLLFISIYNDQGRQSQFWKQIKAFYNKGFLGKMSILGVFIPYFVIRGLTVDAIRLKQPFLRYEEYKRSRGMSMMHDWVDWLGGYPFEVAKPEAIFDFCRARGFLLERLKTCGGGLGCNEFVFRKGYPERG